MSGIRLAVMIEVPAAVVVAVVIKMIAAIALVATYSRKGSINFSGISNGGSSTVVLRVVMAVPS